MQLRLEFVLRHHAVLIVLHRVRDAENVVVAVDLAAQRVDEAVRVARQADRARNRRIALARFGILRIVADDLRQIHRVGGAVDDVAVLVCRARLVRHRVDNAQQRVRERHAGQALRIMHLLARRLVPFVRGGQVFKHHLDRLQRQRVRKRRMHRRDVRLNRMRQSVHARVRGQFGRHRLRKRRVDDRDVRRDVEVGQRVFDALLVVRDDRERRDFRRRAGGRGDRHKLCLRAQRRELKRRDQVLELRLRILVKCPHRLGGVDRGTAADGDDPVRLEGAHRFGALHDGLDGRVRLHALKQLRFHAGLFQISDHLVQKPEPFHTAAADHNDRAFAVQGLQLR